MDIASLIGIVGGFGILLFGILYGNDISTINYFIDIPSVLITIGGSLTSTLTSMKVKDFTNGFKSMQKAIKEPTSGNAAENIHTILDLSNVSRKEGLLALEQAADGINDEFLKKGIMLVVDGTDPDLVRAILETDLDSIEARHKKNMAFWDKWAEMGPAWGMIGTLVGLIIMLQNMSDSASIGPAMGTALITTLYGSLIANWLATPTSAKLAVNNDNEIQMKTIIVEGLLSIQAGENPRVIEEKLKTFLAPADRAGVGAEAGGAENG